MKFAGNGGTLFHHNQLLLAFLISVQRQRSGQLLDQRINHLLLIVTQMAPVRQRRQQNAVLRMGIGKSPFQRSAAVDRGQRAARAEVAPFVITTAVGLAGELLMIIFIFQVINPQFNIVQQRQVLQAVQHRGEALAQRHLGMQAAVGLPQECEQQNGAAPMIELVIVSRLLEYPDAALWQHQQELFDALASSENLDKEDAQSLAVFLRDLTAQEMLDVQASYSELFDRGRATSLLLFEHVHGESRDRGQAMVDLMAQYEQHGLQLDSRELPDHLPLYLEYLAQLPKNDALGGLQDIAPILALLGARLQQRESRYAVLFDLLLKLANTVIDSDKVAEKIADEVRDDTPQALDAVWEEEQVKFFAEQGCGESEISAHQRRFAGAVAPQYLNITTGGQQ
ncbi:nitrate reductase molybdenum cofactor assembly chaperone [Citrobacter koseri]|nr:nitrate reductase molybdenum cofactor assembly chaperone [Citrobacter koseri]